MAQLLSRIPLAQKLRFEPAVAELFQEANPLNRAGTALNEDLIPRIIESKEKQSARNEFVGMGSAAPEAGALTGFLTELINETSPQGIYLESVVKRVLFSQSPRSGNSSGMGQVLQVL